MPPESIILTNLLGSPLARWWARSPDTLPASPFRYFSADLRGLMIFLGLVIATLVSVWPTCSLAANGAPQEPMEIVQKTVDQVIHLLKDKSIPIAKRRLELIRLVEGHFDFVLMARSTLDNHWKELSREQRRQFIEVFVAFIEDAYVGKIESYSGQPIQFLKAMSIVPDGVEVDTNILQPDSAPVQVNYLMKQESNDWKVYDVTINGISIIENYRNQFMRVINERGFDALMSKIRQKRNELEASPKS